MSGNCKNSDGSDDTEDEFCSPPKEKKGSSNDAGPSSSNLIRKFANAGAARFKTINSIRVGRRNGLAVLKLLVLSMNSNAHYVVKFSVVVIKVNLTFLAILMEQSKKRE